MQNTTRFLFRSAYFAVVCLVQPVMQQVDEITIPAAPIVRLGILESKKISESSGLASCGTRQDAIWTLNDSGNSTELFLVSTGGKLLGEIQLVGVANRDWESMCSAVIDGKRYLVVGDVGDNNERRKSCQLFVLPEPTVSSKTVPEKVKPVKIEFQYPDGAHNCEAIAFDQQSNKLWLIEKRYIDDRRKSQPGVFELALQLKDTDKPIIAQRIGDFPVRNVTGMDFSPDGTRLIVRNYLNAHLYVRPSDKTWRETLASQKPTPIIVPIQRQGEAVCFTPNSKSVILTSEKTRQPVWQVNLDQQLRASEKKDPPSDK